MSDAPNRLINPKPQPEDRLDQALRPRFLKDLIGQERVRENLSILIDASRQRGEPIDHVLFYGPPGLGKTTLAHILANEMGVNIKVTAGPAIERPGDLAAILSNLRAGDILFIDEVHRLGRSIEEVLYPAMEDFALDIIIGKGPSARSIRLKLPRFTVTAATTRLALVSAPLRARFGAVHRLNYYNLLAMRQIVNRAAGVLGVELTRPLLLATHTTFGSLASPPNLAALRHLPPGPVARRRPARAPAPPVPQRRTACQTSAMP